MAGRGATGISYFLKMAKYGYAPNKTEWKRLMQGCHNNLPILTFILT